MKIAFRLLLLAAAAGAGVWLWTVLFPGPEKIIRKQLAAVASETSFTTGENMILAANRAENLASHFSTNVEVNINLPNEVHNGFLGHPEITQAAATIRSSFKSFKVEFLDVNVTLGPDKQSATADLTVHVQTDTDKDFIVQEMKITFQKIDADWLITRVETVRTLSQNGDNELQPGRAWRYQSASDGQPVLCG